MPEPIDLTPAFVEQFRKLRDELDQARAEIERLAQSNSPPADVVPASELHQVESLMSAAEKQMESLRGQLESSQRRVKQLLGEVQESKKPSGELEQLKQTAQRSSAECARLRTELDRIQLTRPLQAPAQVESPELRTLRQQNAELKQRLQKLEGTQRDIQEECHLWEQKCLRLQQELAKFRPR